MGLKRFHRLEIERKRDIFEQVMGAVLWIVVIIFLIAVFSS